MSRQTPNHYSKSIVSPNQNQFQALSEFPSLPYSQVVRNIAPVNPNKIQTPTSTHTSKIYFTKPKTHHITLTRFSTPPDFKTLKDILSRYLPEGCQWYSDDIKKNQRFYEYILVDSQSIELVHNHDPKNPNRVSFSKCIIKKVLRSEEWTFPFSERGFSKPFNPKGYTYPDYKMAWFKMFLFRAFDHSWFFTFHTDFLKNEFPIWFLEWWSDFGPLPNILPPDVLEGYNYFILKAQLPVHLKDI